MSVSRKCPNCHQWNTDREYCLHCNTFLNRDAEIRIKENAEIRMRKELNSDAVDLMIERLRRSNSFGGRMLYYLVRSVWFFVFIFLTVMYSIIALIAG